MSSSREILKSIQSLNLQILYHEQKLASYPSNPFAHDNQGLLRQAPSREVQMQIIQGRIRKLEREISGFRKQIEQLREALSKMENYP